MTIRNVTEAKAELSKLLTLVESGEEVIISRAGKPIAKIVHIQQLSRPRRLGLLREQWQMPEGFDIMSKELDSEIETLMNK